MSDWDYKKNISTAEELEKLADDINGGYKYTPASGLMAKDINDIIETSLFAADKSIQTISKSNEAITKSSEAVSKSNEAALKSNEAVSKSDEAVLKSGKAESNSESALAISETALSNSRTAIDDSQTAFRTAQSVRDDANAGRFKGERGDDGVLVETHGMYAFMVIEGDLILCHHGETAPDLSINADGELIYNF